MTNTTIRRAASAFIVLALALGASACSDDEEGTDDTGTEEAATDEGATDEGTSSEDYTAEEMTAALEDGGFSAETATCVVDEMFATFEQDRINEIAASADAYATDEEYQGIVVECAEANGDSVPEPAAVEGEG